MIQALATSFILAAISGISYLAYKYPKAYSRLYFWFMALAILPYAGMGIWDSALGYGQDKLKLSLAPDQAEISKIILAESKVPLGIPTLFLFLYVLYLGVLLFLPHFLEEDKKEKKPK